MHDKRTVWKQILKQSQVDANPEMNFGTCIGWFRFKIGTLISGFPMRFPMSFPIHGFLLLELVVARQPQPQRHQPQMSYVSVPSVPEPASYLRPLLREARDLALSAGDCYEACFVAHVDSVVRSSAARAWAKLDANSDGQLDLEEQKVLEPLQKQQKQASDL